MSLFNTPRKRFFLFLLSCLLAMAIVLGVQYWGGIDPCSLCVMQRIGVLGAALVYFIGFIHGPKHRYCERGYLVLAGVSLLFGLVMAARQVWLQYLPLDQAPACGPGIGYLFQNFPFQQAFMMVFKGSGDCAIVHTHFLGLSIAEWSLLWFVLMLVGSVLGWMKARQ